MNRRLFLLGILALATAAPAGTVESVPVLPEMRQHLEDGWACLKRDPGLARDHALAVLMGREILVGVDLDAVPRDRRTACRLAVDDALEAWQTAIGGEVKLHRLPEGGRSGIVIRFQPDVREDGEPVAGYVNWKRTIGRDVTGVLQIRTVALNGETMPGRAMRGIVLHEIGHLLGLDDTDRDGEAMSSLSVSSPASRPSEREAEAVRALRAEADELLRSSR